MTYTDRGTFDGAVGFTTLEDFEDESLGVLTLPETMNGSGLMVDLFSGSVTAQIASNEPAYPQTSGFQNLAFGVVPETGDYIVSFMTGGLMSAFGFDLTGYQPTPFLSFGYTATFLLGGSLIDSVFLPGAGSLPSTVRFFGFATNFGFDEVRLSFDTNLEDDTSDFVGFDDVAFNVVPEPTTAALLALGLVGMAAVRRRAQ
jgi:hypothetical protein